MSALYRRWLLVLLITASVLSYADRQLIAVLKPLLQEKLAWSDGDYGHLTALFQFATAVALLGAGWIVDRIGWRRANPLAAVSWSLATMAHAAVHTLGQFSLARITLGVTESLGTPTTIKTIAAVFQARERSFALGAVNAANNVGAIVTPLFVPLLALTFGWKAAFLVTGGLGLVWVAVWQLVMASDAARMGDESLTETAPPPDAQPASAKTQWRVVLTDRRTWAIAGAKVLTDQVWWFLLFWMPDFFHRTFNLDMRSFAAPLAVVYTTAALGSILGGVFSGRLIAAGLPAITARQLTMLGFALLAVPLPLALRVDNYWLAVVVLSVTLAAHQGFSVNLFALATDVTPVSRLGMLISVGAFFGNLAGMAVLQAAGALIGGGYGYAPLFGSAAVSYILALGWVRLLLSGKRQNVANTAV